MVWLLLFRFMLRFFNTVQAMVQSDLIEEDGKTKNGYLKKG
jgi:hypothetical protein